MFRDSNILSIPDDEHGEVGERWISLGLDETGILILVCHTFKFIDSSTFNIRIISARKATKKELKQYEEGICFMVSSETYVGVVQNLFRLFAHQPFNFYDINSIIER